MPWFPWRWNVHNLAGDSATSFANLTGMTVIIQGAAAEAEGLLLDGQVTFSKSSGGVFYCALFESIANAGYSHAGDLGVPIALDEEVDISNQMGVSCDAWLWGICVPLFVQDSSG